MERFGQCFQIIGQHDAVDFDARRHDLVHFGGAKFHSVLNQRRATLIQPSPALRVFNVATEFSFFFVFTRAEIRPGEATGRLIQNQNQRTERDQSGIGHGDCPQP